MRVGIVGLSHLGIVTGAAIASHGFEVTFYDPDEAHIQSLRDYKIPFFESGLEELLKNNKERIVFTSDEKVLKQPDIIYIARDVPTNGSNVSDISGISALAQKVLSIAESDTTVVIHSQVPPSFTRNLLSLSKAKLYYQVETLVFGIAVKRALEPERYIVGCSNAHEELPQAYKRLLEAFNCPILKMDYESAELAKIAINMFLISSVATSNTLADLCERIGAKWSDIASALRLDRRIGQYAYLKPGLGIAGGNLERDKATILALADNAGSNSAVIEGWTKVLNYSQEWVLRTLHNQIFPFIDNPTIAVWGLAYKEGTSSIKNSPSMRLLSQLKDEKLKVFDPVVDANLCPSFVERAKDPLSACNNADVLIVMTPGSEFREADLSVMAETMAGKLIIDPYGVLDGNLCTKLGLSYFTLGEPSRVQTKQHHKNVSTPQITIRKAKSRSSRNIVVLGSRGFLGSHLCRSFEDATHKVDPISSKEIDLRCEESVESLAKRITSDSVVVITSALTPDKGRDVETLHQNITMMKHICAALNKSGCEQVIYVGSDAVYADGFSLISEDSPCAPSSLHGSMHLCREGMLRDVTSKKGVCTTFLRPCALFGPGDTHNSYGPNRFIRSAKNSGTIALTGEGEEKRDHLYVNDFSSVVEQCIAMNIDGTFNIASGKAVSFMDIALHIKAMSESPVAIECSPRKSSITYRHFDITRLLITFPDFTFTPFDEALRTTFSKMED